MPQMAFGTKSLSPIINMKHLIILTLLVPFLAFSQNENKASDELRPVFKAAINAFGGAASSDGNLFDGKRESQKRGRTNIVVKYEVVAAQPVGEATSYVGLHFCREEVEQRGKEKRTNVVTQASARVAVVYPGGGIQTTNVIFDFPPLKIKVRAELKDYASVISTNAPKVLDWINRK